MLTLNDAGVQSFPYVSYEGDLRSHPIAHLIARCIPRCASNPRPAPTPFRGITYLERAILYHNPHTAKGKVTGWSQPLRSREVCIEWRRGTYRGGYCSLQSGEVTLTADALFTEALHMRDAYAVSSGSQTCICIDVDLWNSLYIVPN